VVICLEQGADLHMAQLLPLPLTVSCSSKVQIGCAFLVPDHPGSPVKQVFVCVCLCPAYTAGLARHYRCSKNGENLNKKRLQTN